MATGCKVRKAKFTSSRVVYESMEEDHTRSAIFRQADKMKSLHWVLIRATLALRNQIDSGLVLLKDSLKTQSQFQKKNRQRLLKKITRYQEATAQLQPAASSLSRLSDIIIDKQMKTNEEAGQFLAKHAFMAILVKHLDEFQSFLQKKHPKYLEYTTALSRRYLQSLPQNAQKEALKDPARGFAVYYFGNASKQEALTIAYLLELQFFQEAWAVQQQILKE